MQKNATPSVSNFQLFFNTKFFKACEMIEYVNALEDETVKDEINLAKYPIFRYKSRSSVQYGFRNSKISYDDFVRPKKFPHIKKISPLLSKIIQCSPREAFIILSNDWENYYDVDENKDVIFKQEDVPSEQKSYVAVSSNGTKTSEYKATSYVSDSINIVIPLLGGRTCKVQNEDYNKDYITWVKEFDKDYSSRELRMSHMLYRITLQIVKATKNPYWDERQLFRFYVLNAFLSSEKSSETYGEFFEKNKEELWLGYRNVNNDYNNKHTKNLYEAFIRMDTVLNFYELKSSETQEIFNTFTKQEILKIIENYLTNTDSRNVPNDFVKFPIVGFSGRGYLEKLNEVVKILREDTVINYDHDLLQKKIFNNLCEIFKKNNVDVNFAQLWNNKNRAVYDYVYLMQIQIGKLLNPGSFDYTKKNSLTPADKKNRIDIFNNLFKNSDNLSAEEISGFIYALSSTKSFVSRGGEKSFAIIVQLFDKYGVENSVRFIAETMMYYNHELPSVVEWKKFIKENDKIDFELDPSLIIPFVLSTEKKQNRDMIKIEKVRSIIRRMNQLTE